MGKRETEKEKAFKQLFEASYEKLYYASILIVNDEDEARNIVDDTFAALWEKFDPLTQTYNSSYLYTIVQHRSLDFLKRQKVRELYARNYRMTYSDIAEDFDNDDERLKTIETVMSKMTRQTRFAIDQCYMEGKKYAEVAEMLGISTSSVKKHIIKALRTLRELYGSKDARNRLMDV